MNDNGIMTDASQMMEAALPQCEWCWDVQMQVSWHVCGQMYCGCAGNLIMTSWRQDKERTRIALCTRGQHIKHDMWHGRFHGTIFYSLLSISLCITLHCFLQVCLEETVYGYGEEAEATSAAETPKRSTGRYKGGVSATTPSIAMSKAVTSRSKADYTCYSIRLSKTDGNRWWRRSKRKEVIAVLIETKMEKRSSHVVAQVSTAVLFTLSRLLDTSWHSKLHQIFLHFCWYWQKCIWQCIKVAFSADHTTPTLSDVMVFLTGCDIVPPLGYGDTSPTVIFSDTGVLPTVSTCSDFPKEFPYRVTSV